MADIVFSTKVSHGCFHANLFSRPESAPNHMEDAIYALLRIADT